MHEFRWTFTFYGILLIDFILSFKVQINFGKHHSLQRESPPDRVPGIIPSIARRSPSSNGTAFQFPNDLKEKRKNLTRSHPSSVIFYFFYNWLAVLKSVKAVTTRAVMVFSPSRTQTRGLKNVCQMRIFPSGT